MLAAALGGADQYDLGRLAREMTERAQTSPDRDDDGFDERAVWLETTLGDAGRLQGDLTPACAAALTVVLEALGQKAGPEDDRSLPQRRHDAIEEACRRLIRARMVPGRDSQPAHLQVHVDLAELRALPGASVIEAVWSAAKAAAGPGSVYLAGPDAQAAACDAAITPVVSGQIDWAVLDRLTGLWLDIHTRTGSYHTHPGHPATARPQDHHRDAQAAARPQDHHRDAGRGISPATRARLHASILQWSVDLLPGPGGLAAAPRGALLGAPFTGLSQPLDLGRATRTIPSHLRAAVIARDRHCQFPGCTQPPSVCEVHHLVPWAHGGATSLGNLGLYCRFHHLIVIHRWGWTPMPRT